MNLAEPHASTLAEKRLARTSIDHTASSAVSDDLATMVEQVLLKGEAA